MGIENGLETLRSGVVGSAFGCSQETIDVHPTYLG